MLCFSTGLWLRRLAKSAPKNGRVRRIGYPRCRQNLHHAVARERFGSQNLKKWHARPLLAVRARKICTTLWREVSDHFWRFGPPKLAPRCGRRANWKPKPLKHQAKCFSHDRRRDFGTASTQTSLKGIVILRSRVCSTCLSSGMFRCQ